MEKRLVRRVQNSLSKTNQDLLKKTKTIVINIDSIYEYEDIGRLWDVTEMDSPDYQAIY